MKRVYCGIVSGLCLCGFLLGHSPAEAQTGKYPEAITPYFAQISKQAAAPDTAGFIRRWLLLDPISVPIKTNTVFTDSYLKEKFYAPYFRVSGRRMAGLGSLGPFARGVAQHQTC